MKGLLESIKQKRNPVFQNKKAWMRIVEAFIAVILIMTVMLVVIERQRIGLNSVEEIQIKQRNILNLIARDDSLRAEILSWRATQTNEKLKYLVPAGYNYSIELCQYDQMCSLNFTVPTDVFSDETIIISNLTHYISKEAVKLKLFFWRGPFPEGQEPHNYSEPFREVNETITPAVCSNECSAVGINECIFGDLRHFNVCGNFDADSCFEWNSTKSVCPGTQMCFSGNCIQAYPLLTVSYTAPQRNLGVKPACAVGDDIWYYYNMTVSEVGKVVGTNFGSRKRCSDWTELSGVKHICDALNINMPAGMPASILAGQTINVTNRWFCIKSGYVYNVSETFYSDSAGTNALFNYTVYNVN